MTTTQTTKTFGSYGAAGEYADELRLANPGKRFRVRCVQGLGQGGTKMVVQELVEGHGWTRR